MLLLSVSDWRWLVDREDSPWYSTMRLFRQPAIGDWTSAIGAVAQRLKAEASGVAKRVFQNPHRA
ncbi:MAG: hypothetical protein ABSB42_06375 [Tepidisphaeraceae bacterium]